MRSTAARIVDRKKKASIELPSLTLHPELDSGSQEGWLDVNWIPAYVGMTRGRLNDEDEIKIRMAKVNWYYLTPVLFKKELLF